VDVGITFQRGARTAFQFVERGGGYRRAVVSGHFQLFRVWCSSLKPE
jgi:hypothetical protein